MTAQRTKPRQSNDQRSMVAVDLDIATAQRVQRLVQEEAFAGCERADARLYERFLGAVEDALNREHTFTDSTGFCVRCGAEEPGSCSGGAQ